DYYCQVRDSPSDQVF
nr:immunoglobulin light chain junction region [Macaca mulatta]MOX17241.1 immunoglobulin light chain junction region [Macaca mulatta]MOX17746.1 immunoglobulin light chain junction region [Macaca mulatta]MOX18020.1 immunoglobulin light chain junction region [Macaca mulatta]MOX18713.1 immunoglobulin light chain junction region [Macaca mulatta]